MISDLPIPRMHARVRACMPPPPRREGFAGWLQPVGFSWDDFLRFAFAVSRGKQACENESAGYSSLAGGEAEREIGGEGGGGHRASYNDGEKMGNYTLRV